MTQHPYDVMSGFSELVTKYDAFLVDLWGVVHDGTNLYPGVIEMLEHLRAEKKPVVFISNAPRRSDVVEETLRKLKIKRVLYSHVASSGEVAFQYIKKNPAYYGATAKKYLYLGPEKDATILHGIGLEQVRKPESAGFVMCTGFPEDDMPLASIIPLLNKCLEAKLPMVCANPDLNVVRLTGEKILCAGLIAREYAKMGGQVFNFGKPYAEIYDIALKMLGEAPKEKVLAIGDGIETDILGACNAGLDSAYITGGILKVELNLADGATPPKKVLDALFKAMKASPTYVVPGFTL